MNNHQEIHDVLNRYFDAIYRGDVPQLKGAFHPQAILFGEINGQPYLKLLADYLNAVENRQSPQASGESFRMKTLAVEVLDNIAYAKTHCQMLGFNYFDYLALVRQEGRWLIVNKLFTHVPPSTEIQHEKR
ncbi:nuclear transport factor 2 family protein [Noviherbaspirillum saxi]|uniref:Nuclear transport factor 2 family protein n=1 Tax=Noviherbaspirillum saxi TaxID=2320863 RepID=A0A3A3FFH2_9BURK|nr:nuclear transport factor 2 family protein [Noviherbaspirillum saxi]RJF92000.1 nuclear transport factor 2 family protein [Noviherbaspirillum saxi]